MMDNPQKTLAKPHKIDTIQESEDQHAFLGRLTLCKDVSRYGQSTPHWFGQIHSRLKYHSKTFSTSITNRHMISH